MSGELDTSETILWAFYRLVGVKSGDASLTRRGENSDEIAYYYLTRGARAAQRFMLDNGYKGWMGRSTALSFSGTDAADGGKYTALPTDFLKAAGDERNSCLEEANGDPWGQQVQEHQRARKGNGFYFEGQEFLWLTRNASPPSTLYLRYHQKHPVWESGVTIDFPMDARPLIVAKAANLAKEESWVPGGDEIRSNIARALALAEREARALARPTREPRKIRGPRRAYNHW